MQTTYPSQIADRFLVRLPDGMREEIAASAQANNRSMTKEIVLRLQSSFTPTANDLPVLVRDAVNDEVKKKKCTPAQALVNLVLAGQSSGGKVLNIRIAPGMTIKEVHELLGAMQEDVPDATIVVVDRE